MADKRINALANTAPSTASDDFIAVDGTTNGTRKLNAFSPTFGGNATVTGTLTANGQITSSGGLKCNRPAICPIDLAPTDDTVFWRMAWESNAYNPAGNRALYIAYNGSTTALQCETSGVVKIPNTTASTSTSSGALVVSGGVGVAGALYAANLGGTSTNNNAASGCIGEYTSATTAYASKVSLTSNTAANIVSISLTAGDWDVQFNPVFTQDTPLTTSGLLAGVSSSSATLPSGAAERAHSPSGPNGNSDISIAPPVTRISLASTTTIYGVATGIFSAGTMSAYGFIRARRVR